MLSSSTNLPNALNVYNIVKVKNDNDSNIYYGYGMEKFLVLPLSESKIDSERGNKLVTFGDFIRNCDLFINAIKTKSFITS